MFKEVTPADALETYHNVVLMVAAEPYNTPDGARHKKISDIVAAATSSGPSNQPIPTESPKKP